MAINGFGGNMSCSHGVMCMVGFGGGSRLGLGRGLVTGHGMAGSRVRLAATDWGGCRPGGKRRPGMGDGGGGGGQLCSDSG